MRPTGILPSCACCSPTHRSPSDAVPGHPLDLDALAQAYAVPSPSTTWLRVNMVSTLDGAATGADGLTGSINTSADHVVFELLRAISDVLRHRCGHRAGRGL